MARTLKVLSTKEEGKALDDICVQVKNTKSVSNTTVVTPLQIKNEIALIDGDIARLNEAKAAKAAELVEITAAAQALLA